MSRAHLETRRQLCLAAWGLNNCTLDAGHFGAHSTRNMDLEHVIAGQDLDLDKAEHILYCGQCQWFRPQAMTWLKKHDPERTTMTTAEEAARLELSHFQSGQGAYKNPNVRLSDFLKRNIVISRGDLPTLATSRPPSKNGVTYHHSAGKCHSSIGTAEARKIALEWLAIADDIAGHESAETDRKDELCKEFAAVTGSDSYWGALPGMRAMIDRIYKLEQEAATTHAKLARATEPL